MNKKFLASTLVGLSLMSITSLAFTDDNDTNLEYKYAVNRLTELSIITGNPDGSFTPDKKVTRAEMAKMLAVTLNKGDITEDLESSFTDTDGHWAEKYIAYCVDLGIINGKSETTFEPDSNVTLLEASKMSLIALGIDAETAELVGANWDSNTTYYSSIFEIDLGINANSTDELSKEIAAQVISNTLSAYTAVPFDDTYEPSNITLNDTLEYPDVLQNMPRAIYEEIDANQAIRPNLQVTTQDIEEIYGVSLDNLEYAFSATTPMSPGIDQIFIAKVQNNRLNAVEAAIETYREKVINEVAFYPQDIETAKASKIFTNDAGYIMFIVSSAENGLETAEELFYELAK